MTALVRMTILRDTELHDTLGTLVWAAPDATVEYSHSYTDATTPHPHVRPDVVAHIVQVHMDKGMHLDCMQVPACHVFLSCIPSLCQRWIEPCRSLDWNHTGIPFAFDPPPRSCPSSPPPPQVRGLGGANVLDYTEDRTPVVSLCQEDYINFWGQRVDATFVNVTDADVAVGVGFAPCRGLLAAACLAEAMFGYWRACLEVRPPSLPSSSLLNPSHTVCCLPATLAWPSCDQQAAAIRLQPPTFPRLLLTCPAFSSSTWMSSPHLTRLIAALCTRAVYARRRHSL